MYYEYFGLSEAPFSIAPNPDYLFMTNRHQEALAHLYHSVESDAGFILLTGDVGTGKTTVCRSFLDNLPDDTEVAFILNPFLSGRELLMTICQELKIGEQKENASLRQLTNSIYTYLLDNHAVGKQTVLLIDEAQHLHFKVLELIRLLTNLETDRQKLLKIVLVGQPELNDNLARPELTQLSQRITARYHIKPLSHEETSSYIDYRLRMAGYMSEKKLFPKSIVRKIFSLTNGVPRLINVICDRALLGTYSQNRAVVDFSILNKAIIEVRGEKQLRKSQLWFIVFGASAALLLVIFLAFFFFGELLVKTELATMESKASLSSLAIDKVEPMQYLNSTEFSSELSESLKIDKAEPLSALVQSDVTARSTPIQVVSNKSIAYYVNDKAALKALIQTVRKDSTLIDPNCSQLETVGWQCRKSIAKTWRTLEQYNRPAVITLVNIVGETYYLPVLGISATYVDALTPKGKRRLLLSSLSDEWTAEFVYLWQPPKNFDNYIFFDSDEVLVDWLANAFALIDERDQVLAKGEFNSLLKKRIMLFQRENNLTEDGIAGVETLLKLNEKLGVAVTLQALNDQSAGASLPNSIVN
jgi:general secretion pathway protein A